MHINFKIDKNMKTNSVTYNQADELTKVVRNFLEKKSTFELDSDEQGSLLNFLMGLLIKLEDDYKLNCLILIRYKSMILPIILSFSNQ